MGTASLLGLFQLASSSLPVGAFGYSEGLEWLVESGQVRDQATLKAWILGELSRGAPFLDAALLVRIYRAGSAGDAEAVCHWNAWLSAVRETEELRVQSWQMGHALVNLLGVLEGPLLPLARPLVTEPPWGCNFVTAFGLAAAGDELGLEETVLAYLYSWATNLVGAGVRLIPLGQTAGQLLLRQLGPALVNTLQASLELTDQDLHCCSWGLSLASMAHETQYTRLFRS